MEEKIVFWDMLLCRGLPDNRMSICKYPGTKYLDKSFSSKCLICSGTGLAMTDYRGLSVENIAQTADASAY